MVCKVILSCLICVSLLLQSFPAYAQADGTNAARGPKKRISHIVVAGLGGAVLGLSTLSFYGRPQDKLANIAIGFAFGIIVGTIMTTYQAASDPKDFYGIQKAPANAEIWALDISQQKIQHEWPGHLAPSFNLFSF